jgi:DNA-binding NarL/FixJ family response regulator
MRLMILEDHPALAQGLATLLAGVSDIRIVGVCRNVDEALELFPRARPDVVLCDVMLEGTDAGFALLRERGKDARFLMYSAYDFPAHHKLALDAGAGGFISKTADPDELIAAIRRIADGGTWFPPSILSSARTARRVPTRRELQLLDLVADGESNTEIATAMSIGIKTVEGMLRRLFDRYGVENRTQLARLARQEGWLTSTARPAVN